MATSARSCSTSVDNDEVSNVDNGGVATSITLSAKVARSSKL